jgi:competence protein ComFC
LPLYLPIKNIINGYKNYAHKTRDFIFDLLFPIHCTGCGTEGRWLCAPCFNKLKFKSDYRCLTCKKPTTDSNFCPNCQENSCLEEILIASDYEDRIIADLIKNFKYRFARDIDKILGRFLFLFLSYEIRKYNYAKISGVYSKGVVKPIWHDLNNIYLVPVPLHIKRKKWRGFNQSLLLSEYLSGSFNWPIIKNSLIRTKNTIPQAHLREQERKENISGCFSWHGGMLEEKNIILIDDVVTTGSTLNECAKVLKANGAGEVWGAVVAKG